MAENTVNNGHPKGLYVLFVTEMWERFSYYGMRALFILFMTKALLFDKALGSQIYGSYTGLVYLTPLIGGYVADRYWGNRKSIIVGGIIMAIGQFFMFLSGSFYEEVGFASIMMYTGLGFLIFGNGFFKPNISTMVGQLYPVGDKRVDSAFTIFYMGINLGAFIAPLLCGFFGDTGNPADFKWGFLLACMGMILSVILFVLLKNKYIVTPDGQQIGAAPNKSREEKTDEPAAPVSMKTLVIWAAIWVVLLGAFYFALDKDVIGAFIFSLTIAAPGYIISDPGLTKVEKQRIWVIYIVAFFVIFFWSAFEQAGASLTYFAEEQTNREAFGTTIPASYFQSVNAIAIVVFAPIFVWLWGVLGKKNMEPASPYKQAIGLFLLALGYLVIAFGVKGLEPGVKVSMMWLLSLYTIHTLGELCLSPIGLSMVNKLAPVKFASLLMGVWFLSTAAANKFAGTLSGLYPEAVVAVSDVETIEKDKTLQLFPEGFNKAGAPEVSGQKVIPFERVNLASITDQTVKEDVIKQLYSKQVENVKKFMGFSIANLYDFFMLFVVMAGVASVILFVLSKKLMDMMHGVR
ncbi:peptide MFS transporter [Flavobacterium sp. AG291]|uniref:peptide MFS transporter n=1 Tax=Flavobacterium sp. AG291 TaxID=2184000 RepID=UPI000E0A47AD|nr:peptide MFS transporter [Flavobacterium sp. AG291]RDI15869.1 POT family proton-dependent oligopeptide transporter [Flavobacterium sp. AG291]